MSLLASVLAAAILATTAEPSPASHPYHLLLDAPLTLGSGLAWLALDHFQAPLSRTSCPCDAASLNILDRYAPQYAWRYGEKAANATLALGLALSAASVVGFADDPRSAAEALGLVTESAVVAGLLGQAVKIAVSRPYPYMFRPSEDTLRNQNARNYASFWSGHTAVPMAAATAAALLLSQSSLPWGVKVAAWLVGPTLALTAGLFQMSTANHFPTDIGAGFLAGAAVATGTLWLHGAL